MAVILSASLKVFNSVLPISLGTVGAGSLTDSRPVRPESRCMEGTQSPAGRFGSAIRYSSSFLPDNAQT